VDYRVDVTRIEPHPKAGQTNYSGYGQGSVYPDKMETGILSVVVTEGEYVQLKRAVLSVTDPATKGTEK
jgi:hypothetical protein